MTCLARRSLRRLGLTSAPLVTEAFRVAELGSGRPRVCLSLSSVSLLCPCVAGTVLPHSDQRMTQTLPSTPALTQELRPGCPAGAGTVSLREVYLQMPRSANEMEKDHVCQMENPFSILVKF